MKKIILTIIILFLLGLGVYQFYFKKAEPKFTLIEVSRGTVFQEIWETGRVQRGEKINLGFRSAGEIEKIYIQTNQTVEKGELLAKLDTTELVFQLQEARNSLKLAQLNLEKLLAGASPEEIKIAETQAENARIFLEGAEKDLENSYETAIVVLDACYPQIYNALDFVKEFIKEYITIYDEDGRKIIKMRDEISWTEEKTKLYLEIAKRPLVGVQDIEDALSVMRSSLEATFNNLETLREIIEESVIYRNQVSIADKASLDTLKININSGLTNIVGIQQTISSMKLNIESAKTKFQEAQNRLDLVRAEARRLDVDLYETQIKQAQIQVQFYENQIEKATLRSPVKAQVMEIKKKEGEMVQPMLHDTIISLLPIAPFEIVADIYEEDIVKIEIGAPVKINLPAFPKQTLKGSVTFIDEAEKIIDGVVYYEIKIAFEEEPPEGIKTTMTADIVIPVVLRENVLIVPRETIQKREVKTIVEVFRNGLIEEREIEIGVKGDEMVEVASGLAEGEKVIIR